MLTAKRLFILFVIVLISFSGAQARKKKPRAGKIVDGVYTDSKYHFTMNILENWKPIIQKNDKNVRLTLIQKNYEVPPDYQNVPDFAIIPRLTMYVGKTPMSAFVFIDSLLSDTYKSKQKKEIIGEFDILNDQAVGENTEREHVITRKRRTVKINDTKAVLWEGKVKYIKYIPLSASASASEGVKSVYSDYRGGIVALKLDDDTILLCHLITEGQFFKAVWTEALKMIESISWEKKK